MFYDRIFVCEFECFRKMDYKQRQQLFQQQPQTPPLLKPSTSTISTSSESESSPPGPTILPKRDGKILKCQWPRCHKSFDEMSHYIFHEYFKHLNKKMYGLNIHGKN